MYLSLYPFNRAVHKAKIFNIDFHADKNVLITPLIEQIFSIKSKSTLPSPRLRRFSPTFLSESFIVLPFPFKSMIHFALIFVPSVAFTLKSFSFLFACRCLC